MSAKKASPKNTRQNIIKKYQEYLLLEGKDPASIYAFCKDLGIEEGEFFTHFADFDQVATAFWLDIYQEITGQLTASAEWEEFSTRERLLSFYFSFFERLKANRSYALLTLQQDILHLNQKAKDLRDLKEAYQEWVQQLLMEGQGRQEIAGRSKFNDLYDKLFWYQFLFLLDFWRKDRSAGFERTDEAIEKSVNLAFDLIEKNALDSAFDLGKFIFQNK